MSGFQYKVVPAPKRAVPVRGVKSEEERFARVLEDTMNDLAKSGWEFHRAERLPADIRKGWLRRETVFQDVLVFRRERSAASSDGRAGLVATRSPEDETAERVRKLFTRGEEDDDKNGLAAE
ncbi:hypothetical protein SAMN05421688_1014 [Poseidonocella pacifica]|uniref:DUF4177 domain-containing protein n=1 Tax=Poseidonocella pacifica TaxID=871651 RepID=A0A1I0VUV6_9RHOB|nr:hypothetical protein [Poseidonocella pacifica]SFA80195.1 hypothetical protein SAMN05421688_1014 [Poseidonocella pacifica]